MSDLLKGLGGNWTALYSWTFPSALAVGAFWLLIYSQLSHPPFADQFSHLSAPVQTGMFIGLSLAIGLLLNALSTPLYRFLEGYSWPARLQNLGVERQREIKRSIERKGEGWILGLNLEKISRFPLEDTEIAPSRLGNALRAFETYGSTRFNLDSQVLWNELCSVVPKYLQDEIDRSRTSVDFFVALWYLSAVFGVITSGAVLGRYGSWWLLIYAAMAFASMLLWYRSAVVSSTYWASTVQALVNVGRPKLAEQMGLEMPATIDAEREMWWLVTEFVADGNGGVARELDRYRNSVSRSGERAPELQKCGEKERTNEVTESPQEADGDGTNRDNAC